MKVNSILPKNAANVVLIERYLLFITLLFYRKKTKTSHLSKIDTPIIVNLVSRWRKIIGLSGRFIEISKSYFDRFDILFCSKFNFIKR